MKLANVLFASTAVVLGIAACAAPPSEEHEDVDTSSQALCPKGQVCTKWGGGTFGGIGGSSGLVFDPGTGSTSSSGGTGTIKCGIGSGQEFKCGGPVVTCDGTIAKVTGDPCDMTVREVNGQYDCVPGCGGGGYSFGGWSPCMYGATYTCDRFGNCRCS